MDDKEDEEGYKLATLIIDKTGVKDPCAENVIYKIATRSLAGDIRFGQTLAQAEGSILHWCRNAQEEALDTAMYLEKIILKLEVNNV